MHQLILLRHAKAMPAAAGASDHERPLSAVGVKASNAVGKNMRLAGLAPDVVLVSSSLRTQQTLDAVEAAARWDERPNIDSLETLYLAGPQQIMDVLRNLPETVRSALVIGHNPGLHDVARLLTTGTPATADATRLTAAFPTASLAEFMVTSAWRQLAPASACLQRFLAPGG